MKQVMKQEKRGHAPIGSMVRPEALACVSGSPDQKVNSATTFGAGVSKLHNGDINNNDDDIDRARY